jgi:hypothetical protein
MVAQQKNYDENKAIFGYVFFLSTLPNLAHGSTAKKLPW